MNPNSALETDTEDEEWFRGVCKVIVKDAQGKDKSYGTGFLLKFAYEQKGMISGFLTCQHVVNIGKYQTKLADTSQIYLYFHSLSETETLSKIQKTGKDPISGCDFYFAILTDEFCNKMTSQCRVHFIEPADHTVGEAIFVPQHAEGKNERQVAKGEFDRRYAAEPVAPHTASTLGGSSGAPLLQFIDNEMKVIGINRGSLPGTFMNLASTISPIVNHIKGKL